MMSWFRKFFNILRHFPIPKRNFVRNNIGNAKYKTMDEIRKSLFDILEQTNNGLSSDMKSIEEVMKFLPATQEDIPVRYVKDSFDTAVVPLETDYDLKQKYKSNLGRVRLGRLVEDLDLFAGHITYRHVFYPHVPEGLILPIMIVTVNVSQIDFLDEIKLADVRFSGHVCWVGKSSVEVVVWLHQEVNGSWKVLSRALFLMAARNPLNTGPALVNAIKPETEEEQKLFEGGEARKTRRHQMMRESLLNTIPTERELKIVHSLFINTIDPKGIFLDSRVLPSNSKWMRDATLNTLVFCYPQHGNLNNKIFGGYLMRKALELSWLVAYNYGMKVPKLIRISDIGFYTPVEIGSIVKLTGSVTYTEGTFVQVLVSAKAYLAPQTNGTNSTMLNFTYDLGKEADRVFPSTYLEAMIFLYGRRIFKNVLQL